MITLKTAVENQKCRKGKSDGITKQGAYWLACDPITIREHGGDGIGQSAPSITWTLELRHFRNGEVRSVLHRYAWHQNGSWSGGGDRYFGRPSLADMTTVEEIVANLKEGTDEEKCYSDHWYGDIKDALVDLGMVEAEPSPDQEV